MADLTSAEEKLFTELDELAVASFDAANDEVLVYDSSEPDLSKQMKRMKASGIKGSVSGKIIRMYEDGPKEADSYWISAGKLWRTKAAFTSAAAPMAGAYWELVQLGGTSAFSDLTGLPSENTALANAFASKVDTAAGKGLSSNDYTTAEKTKLDGVATGATANTAATGSEVIAGTEAAKFVVPSALSSWWSSMRALAASWAGRQTFNGGINVGNITKPAAGKKKAIGVDDAGNVVEVSGEGTSLTADANPLLAGQNTVFGVMDANGKFLRLPWSVLDLLQRSVTLGSVAEPALLEIISTVSEISAADGKALSIMINNADSANPIGFQIINKANGKIYYQVRYSNGVQSVVVVENFELDMLIDMLCKFRGARVETAAAAKVYFNKPGTSDNVVLGMPDNGNFIEFEGKIVGNAQAGGGVVSCKFHCLARKEGGVITVEAVRGSLPSSNWAAVVTSFGLEATADGMGAKAFITPAVSTPYDFKLTDVYLTNNL